MNPVVSILFLFFTISFSNAAPNVTSAASTQPPVNVSIPQIKSIASSEPSAPKVPSPKPVSPQTSSPASAKVVSSSPNAKSALSAPQAVTDPALNVSTPAVLQFRTHAASNASAASTAPAAPVASNATATSEAPGAPDTTEAHGANVALKLNATEPSNSTGERTCTACLDSKPGTRCGCKA